MDFTKHIQKAEEAAQRRNYDFAVELYRQLLDLDPDLGQARAGLRQVLKKRFEGKRGGKLLRAVGGAAPMVRAKAMAKLGKHEACAKALEDYLATNPVDEEANLLLGIALEQAGFLESARAVYEFVAEIAPRNPEGLKRAGSMLQRKGEPARALEYYERALAVDPRDQEALKARKNLAAETALSRTNLEGAAHSRERLVDADRAASLERGRRRHLSEEDLRAELARLEERYAGAPSDPELMVELAEVHERLGDPEAAVDLVERALQYRKGDEELAARRDELQGKLLKRALSAADREGRTEDADRLEGQLLEHEVLSFRRRVEERPTDAALRVQLGLRLMRRDDLDGALAEFQKAGGDPRVGDDARFHMAQCFHRKGFLDLATKEYGRALEGLAPEHPRAKEILYSLGSISEAEGDLTGARGHFTLIYEVDIGYRDVAVKMEQLR